jgi:hypothetical protein
VMRRAILAACVMLWAAPGWAQSAVTTDPAFDCGAPYIEATPLSSAGFKSGTRVAVCQSDLIHGAMANVVVDNVQVASTTWTCATTVCSALLPAEAITALKVTGIHTLMLIDSAGNNPIINPATVIAGCRAVDMTTSPATQGAGVVAIGSSIGGRNQMASANFAASMALLAKSGYDMRAWRTQPQLDSGNGSGGYWHYIGTCEGSPQKLAR